LPRDRDHAHASADYYHASADYAAPDTTRHRCQADCTSFERSDLAGGRWNASTDNAGVAGYSVYGNGSKITSTTDTSYTYSGLLCGTTYNLGIDAYDAAGNILNVLHQRVDDGLCRYHRAIVRADCTSPLAPRRRWRSPGTPLPTMSASQLLHVPERIAYR